MATFQVVPPEKFSFKAEEWPKWFRRFERFRIASKLVEESEVNQVNALIYMMGDEADDILKSFSLSEANAKKYDAVKQKFQEHFIIKRNVIFERAKFNSRSQHEGELVDNFITDLYNLAEYCNFGALKNELIRDRIVVGIRDKALSEKLQLEHDLTLERAINFVRQKESVRKQQSVLRGEANQQVFVDSVKNQESRRRTGKQRGKAEDKKPRNRAQHDSTKCGRCLGPPHPRKDCPASDSICHQCKMKGHWKKACRSKKVNEVAGETIPEFFLVKYL